MDHFAGLDVSVKETRTQPVEGVEDTLTPTDWRDARLASYSRRSRI
jgi:hypothetical protein